MSKKAVIVLSITFFLVVLYGLFQISKSRTFQLFDGLTYRVNTNNKIVALTFDDAPSEYSDQVIAILKEKNIQATFYVIGQNIERYPQQAKAIVNQNHELGNHSYSHIRLVLKSLSVITHEVEKTNELIRSVGYLGEITFRPPNGKKLCTLPWYLSTHNIKTVMWDVEPDTYVSGKPDGIIQYVFENVKPGSIILMHPFCGQQCKADREALPTIIDQLQANGYQFVTVSQLLRFR